MNMDIDKLIQSGANIKIEITPEDLKEFGLEIATRSFEALRDQPLKESGTIYISGERVCEILDISRVTLWQWDKTGITNPIRLGNLKRYRQSDIDALGKR